ncbi:MAG: translocation/assembly module TamB [Prevotellaceae bacterium]|nr:translocation/assembly module TamB [Prevotellaceae bacterium]
MIFLPPIIISIPFVQTAIVRHFSVAFSEQLKTEVSIKSVNIRFFNKALLNDLFVRDLNGDTLLFVKRLDARIGKLPINNNILILNEIKLSDGIFCLRSDSIGTNISLIISNLNDDGKDELPDVKNDTVSKPVKITVKALKLENFKYKMYLKDAHGVEEQPDGIIYKNMSVSGINLDADKIAIAGDSLTCTLNSLSFTERSGFNVHEMSALSCLIRFGTEITLKEFRLIDDFSDVKLQNLSMTYNGADEFDDFLNYVKFDIDIYDSKLAFKTLGFFAPVLKDVPVVANLNAKISGPVANFRSDEFELQTLDNTVLKGRFSIAGLPDIESTMIFADLKDCNTNPVSINTLLSGMNVGFEQDELMQKFGKFNFVGTFTGFFSNFVSNGFLKTSLGDFQMDIMFNSAKNGIGFKGGLSAENFDVGKLTDSENIETVNFSIAVDGNVKNNQNDIFGKGIISSLRFNNYDYTNIELEGRLQNQAFKGMINVSEPNLDFNFNGRIDLTGTDGVPVFDFDADLKHVDMVKLNFNQRDTVGILKANIAANFRASSILDYIGNLKINNLTYIDNTGAINFENIVLNSSVTNSNNFISLKSDFANATYSGQDYLGGFVAHLTNMSKRYMPALFVEKINSTLQNPKSNYKITVDIKNIRKLARIFIPDLTVNNAELKVNIDTNSNLVFSLNAQNIAYGDKQISNMKLSGTNIMDTVNVNLSGDLNLSFMKLNNLNIKNILSNNTVLADIMFIDSINHSDADLKLKSQFSRDPVSGKLSVAVENDKSHITVFSQEWNLEPAVAEIRQDKFTVRGFNINKDEQEVKISGTASKSNNDTLLLNIKDFNLSDLNPCFEGSSFAIDGKMSGDIELISAYATPLMIGAVMIDTLFINNDMFEGCAIGSQWNDDMSRLEFTVRLPFNRELNSINGYIQPDTEEIYASLKVAAINLNLLEPALEGILSNIDGILTGEAHLKGTLSKPDISGTLQLNNLGFTVDYLQTQYILNSNIEISNSKFQIRDGKITDKEGNNGTLNFDLTHKYFADMEFNAKANIKNFHSLNTKEKDNSLFYGTGYATGAVNVRGNGNELKFSITAETNPNTKLYIPISSASQAKEYEFLTFVTKKDSTEETGQQIPLHENNMSEMNLELDLSVTPESEIQILIDPRVGDILRARGQGNLKIRVNPATDLFSIIGDYSIENGDYNFSLPNFSIISKKFNIDKGSRIHFNGNIEHAILDVTALYKDRISIAPLFPQDSTRHYPITCKIMISGRMTNPKLGFDIEIQDVGAEKNAQFKSIVNTDEKMAKQFLSVLVLRSFIPEQSFAYQDLGSATLMANASELLSAQLGNLVSLFNLPIPIDFNFNYNPNSQKNNVGADFEFDFGIQFSDRLIFNGSASNATHSNRNFVGDFDLEYLIGKTKNTRFKVFSKSRDYFSDDMESNRNGLGILYQSQFNTFKDIFRRKRKKQTEKTTN